MFIRAYHWSLLWARWMRSISSPTIFLRSILILFSIYDYVFRVVSSLQVLRRKLSTHFYYLPCVLHYLPISSSIWSPLQYLVKHTCYEAPHYGVFSSFLTLLLGIPFLDTHSLCSSLSVGDPHKTTGKITVLCILISEVLEMKRENKIFWSEWCSVGIALGYRLDDLGSRVRFPAGAGNFSLHHRVQTGSWAHPAS
jgi:hypothetical protein